MSKIANLVGLWVRSPRSTTDHRVESQVAGHAVTNCGRRLKLRGLTVARRAKRICRQCG